MGQDWRPNKAMSTHLIVQMLKLVANQNEGAIESEEQMKWLVFGTFSVLAYVLSLRGAECLLGDIKGMLKYEDKGNEEYFIVALLGKVKGEYQDWCHLLPCTAVNSSGIKVKEWVNALLETKKSHGQVDGTLFSHHDNVVMSTHALDDMQEEVLEELYEYKPRSFPLSITSKE
jgi:hypothetical protein